MIELPEPFRSLFERSGYREAADLPASATLELYARGIARIHVGRDRDARIDLEACCAELGDRCLIELAFLDIRDRLALPSSRDSAARIAGESGQDPELRARALHVLGLAEGKLRRTKNATDALLQAAELYRSIGNRAGIAHVRDTLGSVLGALGRHDLALGHYALSLVEKTQLGDRLGSAITLGNIGRVHLRAGRFREAIDCFDMDLRLSRELGDERGVGRMLTDLGRTHMENGNLEEAESRLRAAVDYAVEHRYPDFEFFARKDLGVLLARSSHHQESDDQLRQAGEVLPAGGEGYLQAVLLAARGDCLLARKDPAALQVLEQAVRGFAKNEVPDLEIPALILFAEALLAQRYRASAEACLQRALKRAKADGYERYLPRIRETMTRLRLVVGAVEEHRALSLPEDLHPAPDGYMAIQELGRGGFGRTFRAFDTQRNQEVAYKVLTLDGLYDVATRRRILASALTELEAASRIRHPGVARVLAVGEDPSGRAYVVQEFVPGVRLRDRMPTTPTADPARVLRGIGRIADALVALHQDGVVHRDLKPENILMVERGGDEFPVLIDFGIAQYAHKLQQLDEGLITGTLEYMSPEQAKGAAVDGNSDVYSLGVVAYEWLAGTRPLRIRAKLVTDVARAIGSQRPTPIREWRPKLAEPVVELIEAMMEKKHSRRPNAAEVARRCEEAVRLLPASPPKHAWH